MQSLLETAYSLQHNLVDALPPQLHPLALESTNPPESIAQLRRTVQQTLLQLRHGLAQFPTTASDRYLTQLRDAAASEAAVLALGRQTTTWTASRRHQDSRDRYRVPTPRSTGKQGLTTLQVLEQIAAELNLVTFRDHDDDDLTPVTLSLGGKLVVVDVTASSAQSHHVQRVKVAYVVQGLDRLSTLAATKLEHLFATSGSADENDDDEEREEREQARWKGIRRILSELKDLDEMADRTGRDAFQLLEQLDATLETVFSRNKEDNVSDPAGAFAASMIPAQDRLLLQPQDSLYPIVIYHATPFAQLGRHWARLVSSSTASPLSRFEIMEALRDDAAAAVRAQGAGIYAVQLELGPLPAAPAEPESRQPVPPPTTTTTTTMAAKKDDDDDRPGSLFLARLIPSEVPILPETGRAVVKALGFGSEAKSESGNGVGVGVGASASASAGVGTRAGGGEGNSQGDGRRARPLDDDDDDAVEEEEGVAGYGERRSKRTRTRTALAWMRAVTLVQSDGQAVNDGEGVTYEQALPPSPPTKSRPLLLRYQLPTTTTPSASASGSGSSPPSSSADNTAASTGSYEASYLAFRSVAHLVAALEILARQARLNELLRSVVEERYGSVIVAVEAIPSSSPPAHGHHGQGGGADKSRRVVEPMSLEELFAPPSADTPLVVPISVGTSGTGLGPSTSSSSSSASASASPPPPPPPPPTTFSLSFPFPALEAAPTDLLGLPLSLHFSLPPLLVEVDHALPSSSSSSSSRTALPAPAGEEELIDAKLIMPDAVVRSLLGGEEARRELEERVRRVVRETGVVGLAVEEVVRTLQRRAVTGMVDQLPE